MYAQTKQRLGWWSEMGGLTLSCWRERQKDRQVYVDVRYPYVEIVVHPLPPLPLLHHRHLLLVPISMGITMNIKSTYATDNHDQH